MNRTAPQRSLPRLMSPRLPVGRRWLTFCRSGFARDLGTSARGVFLTGVLLSVVVTFYVGINVAYSAWLSLGGLA